jgi:hypothetical protein
MISALTLLRTLFYGRSSHTAALPERIPLREMLSIRRLPWLAAGQFSRIRLTAKASFA